MRKRLLWVAALLLVLGVVELVVYLRIQRRYQSRPQMIGTRISPELLKDQPPPAPVPPPATRPPDDQPRPRTDRKPVELTTLAPTVEQLRAAAKGANVIIVVLDAMRADHVGCYGYPRDATPNIDRLARESVVFEEHFCQFPHTTASTASLFTGQYPDTHGLMFETKDEFRDSATVLDPAGFTLEKGLKGVGYGTYLFTANPCASPYLGVGGDFEKVDVIEKVRPVQDPALHESVRQARRAGGQGGLMRSTPRLLEAVRLHVEEMRGSHVLAYVHILPPHFPYESEAPESYLATYKGKQAPNYFQGEAAFSQVWLRTWGDAAPATGDAWVNLYDGNLRWGDNALGELLAMLKGAGVLDKALLIVTADHGEGLGEHRYEFHMTCPYDEALHVPLLIRFPGGKGPVGRIRALTETVDLLPTVMDLFSIPYPKDQVQGKSLLPLLTGQSDKLHDYVFARTAGLYPCYVVRNHDWSMLIYKGGKMRALYDLWDDPRERYNLIAKRPEVAEGMVRAFRAFAKEQLVPPLDFLDPNYKPPAVRELPKQAISEEMRRQLKALGYMK